MYHFIEPLQNNLMDEIFFNDDEVRLVKKNFESKLMEFYAKRSKLYDK